jgi:serralysin
MRGIYRLVLGASVSFLLLAGAPERAAAIVPYVAPPYWCTTNYYVGPNGHDWNGGSSAAPWLTISHAVSALSRSPHPGVCVNVAPGTYTESLYLSNMSGGWDAPNGYLVFRSSIFHGATIKLPYANIYSDGGTVAIQYSHHIIFDGFNVTGYPNVPYAGVHGLFASHSHHIKWINNNVHDVGGGGIITSYSDYIYAQGNVIYNTSCCYIHGASAISDWDAVAVDSNPGFHNVFSNNVIFSNAEGADGRRHTEGHGIALDTFRLGPAGSYPATTLIENNLIYNNGGAGIILYYSNNATIRNNTVYHNRRDQTFQYPGADVAVVNSSRVIAVNNIIDTDISANKDILSIQDQTYDYTNIGNVWIRNLTFNGFPGQPSVGNFSQYKMGTPITAANGNILGSNPYFVSPGIDFHLHSWSPAVGKGTAAYGVPVRDIELKLRTNVIDLGAFAVNTAQ